MGYKIFVSYKYADTDVQPVINSYGQTTVRDYVDIYERQVKTRGSSIYKGESDGEDLSGYSNGTIWNKLKKRIGDSSITVLFISPNMKDPFKEDRLQWIPWEIEYSLRVNLRNDRRSYSNAIVAVILPDRYGNYRYYDSMKQFKIVQSNIDNEYIEVVKWPDFKSDTTRYIEAARWRKSQIPYNNIVKNI